MMHREDANYQRYLTSLMVGVGHRNSENLKLTILFLLLQNILHYFGGYIAEVVLHYLKVTKYYMLDLVGFI